ncbi:hypothetical protein DAI22_06g123300 [Oryza sativa Japonica Group]|nr:hypothetical protein DAI22_06g123300 [Oryza sativa Japonica Group]
MVQFAAVISVLKVTRGILDIYETKKRGRT